MARSLPLTLLIAAVALASTPAFAQFPNIFEQLFNPPRPPADVGQPSRPQTGLPPGPPPRRIQQRPLPPPPGASQQPPAAQVPGAPGSAISGLPPGQRPRGTPQPANTAPQPGDEVIMEPPAQKIENPMAIFSGLDKITGRIITFEVAINETVRFGALEVTPRICYTRPPTASPNTDGFIEVDELTLQGELRRIFTGWMFAASPGLNAVEHPIYDVWLTDCKGGGAAAVTAEAPAEPQQQQQQQQQQRQQQQQQQRPQQPRRVTPAQPLPPPPR